MAFFKNREKYIKICKCLQVATATLVAQSLTFVMTSMGSAFVNRASVAVGVINVYQGNMLKYFAYML